MKLGKHELGFPVILAPMAGVTDLPYRVICKRLGCDLTYTEMVSAKGLFYGSDRSDSIIATSPEERPCAVQIFGRDPAIMADMAVKIAETHAGELVCIDINMGCPAPKITGNGEGSALMKEPKVAEAVINAVAKACPLPVTVKFRKGWDDNSVNAVEFAKMAEGSGAAAIAIHGRTRMQMYSGTADWDIIAEVKNAVRIPVIGNGDVTCGEDAVKLREHTGCDGIMIGRGAHGNPWIFPEVKAALKGEHYDRPNLAERMELAMEHVKFAVQDKGKRGVLEMRKHVAWYVQGMPGAAKIRVRANECATEEEMLELLAQTRDLSRNIP